MRLSLPLLLALCTLAAAAPVDGGEKRAPLTSVQCNSPDLAHDRSVVGPYDCESAPQDADRGGAGCMHDRALERPLYTSADAEEAGEGSDSGNVENGSKDSNSDDGESNQNDNDERSDNPDSNEDEDEGKPENDFTSPPGSVRNGWRMGFFSVLSCTAITAMIACLLYIYRFRIYYFLSTLERPTSLSALPHPRSFFTALKDLLAASLSIPSSLAMSIPSVSTTGTRKLRRHNRRKRAANARGKSMFRPGAARLRAWATEESVLDDAYERGLLYADLEGFSTAGSRYLDDQRRRRGEEGFHEGGEDSLEAGIDLGADEDFMIGSQKQQQKVLQKQQSSSRKFIFADAPSSSSLSSQSTSRSGRRSNRKSNGFGLGLWGPGGLFGSSAAKKKKMAGSRVLFAVGDDNDYYDENDNDDHDGFDADAEVDVETDEGLPLAPSPRSYGQSRLRGYGSAA